MRVLNGVRVVMIAVVGSLAALSMLPDWPKSSYETFTVVNGPKEWSSLNEMCDWLLEESSGEVNDRTYTIEFSVDSFSPDDGEYFGLLQLGRINDGIRIETNNLGDVAVLVQDRAAIENGFKAFSLGQIPIGEEGSSLMLRIRSKLGKMEIEVNGRIASIPRFESRDCAEPKLGVNFDRRRVFPGDFRISVSSNEETRLDILRNQSRKSFPLSLWVLALVLIEGRSRRSVIAEPHTTKVNP